MTSNHNARINGLDTLRAAAILLVLMYHYMVVVSGKNTFGFLTEIGWTGVDLFFVLSGYLIGNQIFSALAQEKEFSLKTFYMRRLLRTVPNYLVILAIYFLCSSLLAGTGTASIWRFLSFTQNIGLRPGETFTHSWSLCIEEQFYLILPMAALLIFSTTQSVRFAWIILCAALLIAMSVRAWVWLNYGRSGISSMDFYQHIYYSSFARFDELLPGVAIALLKNFQTRTYEKILRYGNGLLIVGAISVAVMFYVMSQILYSDSDGYNFWATSVGYSFLAMSFAALTLSALSPDSMLNRIRIPGAERVALWSYAIYLAHKPIFKLAIAPLTQLGISTDSWLGIAVIMAVSVFGGWLLFRLIEKPFMRLRDRYYSSTTSRRIHATVNGMIGKR